VRIFPKSTFHWYLPSNFSCSRTAAHTGVRRSPCTFITSYFSSSMCLCHWLCFCVCVDFWNLLHLLDLPCLTNCITLHNHGHHVACPLCVGFCFRYTCDIGVEPHNAIGKVVRFFGLMLFLHFGWALNCLWQSVVIVDG